MPALALGLMRVVVARGAHDLDWLNEHTSGWPELEQRIAEWPLGACGIGVPA